MTNYNWCHGPSCHEQQTQSRIRGSGTNKVLRTIKIKVNSHNQFGNNIFDYFCNTRCLHDYLNKHAQAIANIAPRTKALETPIKVEKTKYESIDMITMVIMKIDHNACHIKQQELQLNQLTIAMDNIG